MMVAAAIIAIGLSAVSAEASTISVTLEVALGREQVAPIRCSVHVAPLADGGAVLSAAKASGCILDYTLRSYSFGRLVESIDHLTQTPDETLNIVYWAMRENGACTDYGIDGFRANSGDVLTFTYSSWVTFFTPLEC